MPSKWRLFVAIELPQEIKAMLEQEQEILRQQIAANLVRWVNPNGIHLTLKFLGDVPIDRIPVVQDAVETSTTNIQQFDLSVAELGCFPNTRKPTIIWAGLSGNNLRLHALRNAVEGAISPLGFPTEKRPFTPHLTMGRIRREASNHERVAIGELVSERQTIAQHRWAVTELSLIRSVLKPTGAEYSQIYSAALKESD